MPIPPPLTTDQRLENLARAAESRRVRADLKGKLKRGRMSIERVLWEADHDERIAGLKVAVVLESLPGVGKVRAQRLMAELDISPARRLRGLGSRQRAALVSVFPA